MEDSTNSPISWAYSYSSDIWPALITLALAIYLVSYSWRHRKIPAAKPFIIACSLGAFWTLGVILELSAVDFSTKVFWVKYQAIWQLPVGTAITCFILQYAGLDRWLNRRNYILLFLIPLLSILVMVTNDFHHLIWTGFRMKRYVIASPGRLYWIFNSYIYLLGLVNLAVLVRLAVFSPGHRWPVLIILFGQIIARVGYTLDKLDTDLIGPGESVLLTMGVVSVAYAVAFLRFYAIDPVAAARKAVLQQMQQGMFVLDLQGRIADVNPMAAAILGIPEIGLRKKLLTEVMPIDAGVLRQVDNNGIGQTDIILRKENSTRHYDLNLTPLRGRNDELIGQLLLLQDTTEQKRAQTRILEQQRIVSTLQERENLARELHDGIGQMVAAAQLQVKSASELLARGEKALAESCLQRLADVTQEAKKSIRDYLYGVKSVSPGEQSFLSKVQKYLDHYEQNYGILLDLVVSPELEGVHIEASLGAQIYPIIQEALTNARRHSGAGSVRLIFASSDGQLLVTIEDHGKGFNPTELGDKSGFGLRSMQGRAEAMGGRFELSSTPGNGTCVIVQVPFRKEEP